MDTIRTAVIGVGHLGKHHARIMSELDNVTLTGVSDTHGERLKEISDKLNLQGFADYRDLCGNVDAVVIATPTVTHHEICMEFLKAGTHVFVEKPIAASLQEAQDMVESAKTHDRILQVGHSERFNPAMIAAEQHINRPKFIECHRLNMFAPRGTDVDVILDLMIHDLDIVLHFMNMFPDRIDSVGIPVLSQEIDIANTRLNFSNGAVANLTASRVSVTPVRKFRIFQQDMYISIDFKDHNVQIFKRNAPVKDSDIPAIQHIPVEIKKEEPLRLELIDFIHSIRSNTPPKITGETGLRALKAALMILEGVQKHPIH